MNTYEKLRTDLKMSKTQFAKIFDVSPAAVAQWENGTNSPNPVNQAIMIKLREKANKREDTKAIISNLLVGAGFIALLTWIFSENSKK